MHIKQQAGRIARTRPGCCPWNEEAISSTKRISQTCHPVFSINIKCKSELTSFVICNSATKITQCTWVSLTNHLTWLMKPGLGPMDQISWVLSKASGSSTHLIQADRSNRDRGKALSTVPNSLHQIETNLLIYLLVMHEKNTYMDFFSFPKKIINPSEPIRAQNVKTSVWKNAEAPSAPRLTFTQKRLLLATRVTKDTSVFPRKRIKRPFILKRLFMSSCVEVQYLIWGSGVVPRLSKNEALS